MLSSLLFPEKKWPVMLVMFPGFEICTVSKEGRVWAVWMPEKEVVSRVVEELLESAREVRASGE
jgi:hypothetical protein